MENLAQHSCGFEVCLAYHVAESGGEVPWAAIRYAKRVSKRPVSVKVLEGMGKVVPPPSDGGGVYRIDPVSDTWSMGEVFNIFVK